MDFLKGILGEELFAQVSEKVNAHNGNEANKDRQIKIANLGGGEYVGKAKYDALQAVLDGKGAELEKANGLIGELKKAAKGDETLQSKITAYEGQIQTLQQQLAQTQLESALKISLLEAGGADIDYLMFKAQHSDAKPLELGEDGKVKGMDDIISTLKTAHPAQFKQSKSGGVRVEAHPLPDSKRTQALTREEFDKLGYQSRLKLKQESPDLYAEMTGRTQE